MKTFYFHGVKGLFVAHNTNIFKNKKDFFAIDEKLQKLSKIVHLKFAQNGKKEAKNFNVFDSIWIKLSNEKLHFKEIQYVFDSIALNSFLYSITLPLTENLNIQDFINILSFKVKNNNDISNLISFLESNPSVQKNIILGYKTKMLNSKEFNAYINKFKL